MFCGYICGVAEILAGTSGCGYGLWHVLHSAEIRNES